MTKIKKEVVFCIFILSLCFTLAGLVGIINMIAVGDFKGGYGDWVIFIISVITAVYSGKSYWKK